MRLLHEIHVHTLTGVNVYANPTDFENIVRKHIIWLYQLVFVSEELPWWSYTVRDNLIEILLSELSYSLFSIIDIRQILS